MDGMNITYSKLEDIAVFDWTDYTVFFMMLISSALIGIYFGCFGSKQKTASEYLLGGKNMKPVPVALSLVASAISGITLIGVPAEVYLDNATYWLVVPSFLFVCIFFSYFFLPIFYDLNLSCAYEYLELRYDRSVRSITSFFYCAANILFIPFSVYTPSLALSQVTGINMHIISTGVTAVCVFYTMIGGLKAVVWTDFLQTIVTIIACCAIMIIGTIDAGGISHVMKIAYDNGKLDIFNMDPNPFQRNTFWTATMGNFISWTCGLASAQGSIQRFMSLPSARDGQKVLIIYWIGVALLTTVCIYGGLLIYAVYFACDPIEQKVVSRPDQIFPYYIADKIGYIPALPGLFMAGVFSAALSTLSTVLNAIAGTIYEDYIKDKGVSEEKAHIIMKLIVVAIGIFTVLMILVVENMGTILSITYIITSVTSAPVSVVFILGMMIPASNTKGALTGAFASMIFLAWLTIGSSLSQINFGTSSVYPEDQNTCPSNLTLIVAQNATVATDDGVFFFYKLSYMLYFPFGLIFGVIIGTIVSYITGSTDLTKLDHRMISPPLRRFLPKKQEDRVDLAQLKLMTEAKD